MGRIEADIGSWKQILHLEVGCLDFGPVRGRGSLPYYSFPVVLRFDADGCELFL